MDSSDQPGATADGEPRPPAAPPSYSRGHAEILSILPTPTNAPAPPVDAVSAAEAPPEAASGVSPALAAFAVVFVVATVAFLAFTLVGKQHHDTSGGRGFFATAGKVSPTNLASLWTDTTYHFAPGDPSMDAQLRAAFSANPTLQALLRDDQVRVVSRDGHVIAVAFALGLDPKYVGDRDFAHGVFDGLRESLNGAETRVAGRVAIEARIGGVSALATLKRDVIVMVTGPVRAELDPLMGTLMGAVTLN